MWLKSLQCHAVVPSSCRDLLTDPMPESATESLPESGVCVLLLGNESVFSLLPPTGQSILAVIWLVLVPLWGDSALFWLLSLNGGVTVMLGTETSSWPTLLDVDGLDWDFGDSRASTEADFRTRPVPKERPWRELVEEVRSGPENLLIRSLTLPLRCRFVLRDGPVDVFLWLALKACSASSSLVDWWGLSGDWEGEHSGACWKRWTDPKKTVKRFTSLQQIY